VVAVLRCVFVWGWSTASSGSGEQQLRWWARPVSCCHAQHARRLHAQAPRARDYAPPGRAAASAGPSLLPPQSCPSHPGVCVAVRCGTTQGCACVCVSRRLRPTPTHVCTHTTRDSMHHRTHCQRCRHTTHTHNHAAAQPTHPRTHARARVRGVQAHSQC
jgi:hypothetical protein